MTGHGAASGAVIAFALACEPTMGSPQDPPPSRIEPGFVCRAVPMEQARAMGHGGCGQGGEEPSPVAAGSRLEWWEDEGTRQVGLRCAVSMWPNAPSEQVFIMTLGTDRGALSGPSRPYFEMSACPTSAPGILGPLVLLPIDRSSAGAAGGPGYRARLHAWVQDEMGLHHGPGLDEPVLICPPSEPDCVPPAVAWSPVPEPPVLGGPVGDLTPL